MLAGFCLVFSVWITPPLGAEDAIDADVLLKGGLLCDGTGAKPTVGDVALSGERIVGVGTFGVGDVVLEIDCRGLVVCPGFIDLHNHSDKQIVAPETRANVNYLMQGCTTIVTGNCGSGPVAVGEYYAAVDNGKAGTNVAHLLPQGSLREQVMGTDRRSPTAAELETMKQLAAKAMQDGAWGMSTGLIYVPSSYAETAELIELAGVIARGNGIYASHIRNEGNELPAAVDEALRIGRGAGLPVHISHFKSSGRENWGLVRRTAEQIQTARDAGQTVTADQYPYIASSTSLDATLIPTWARAGGREQLIERLDDPAQADRIRDSMQADLEKRDNGAALFIARYAPRKDWVGRTVAEIAKSEKLSPLELAIHIARNGGAAIVNFSMNEDDVRAVMKRPWVATASDGRAYLPGADRPHPRSYGTFPRKIGHYAVRESVISLERAVHSATGLPAEILGMNERGSLKTGSFADVVVFNAQKLHDEATFESPHRYASGVQYVYVNGRPAVFRGMPTGALAGRALRKTEAKQKRNPKAP